MNKARINTLLSPDRTIYNLIGNLCNNLEIVRTPNFTLTSNDFSKSFHKIIFNAIKNLAEQTEAKELNEKNIADYLVDMPKYYKSFKDNHGLEYIIQSKENANINMLGNEIETVKKYSLLRTLASNGFDISNIYDYESLDENKKTKQREELEHLSNDDILDIYHDKIADIQLDFKENDREISEFRLSDDLDTFIESVKETPEIGYSFRNNTYNALFRGMRKGKLFARSAKSGSGKTRNMLADALNVSCDEIYKLGEWIKTDDPIPCLFISTELNKRELQGIALSYLTGIKESVIMSGDYDPITEKKIQHGIEVIKKSNFNLVYVEDFTIQDIENIISRYVKKENVQYIFFDYIQITPALTQYMNKAFGKQQRGDEVLVQFAAKLKHLAEKYDVFIETATQLNRESNEVTGRDATGLRGGMATADKLDFGVMNFKIEQNDLRNLKDIIKSGKKEPNYSHWVYKNRSGMDKIVIWTKIDLGTMKEEVLFVTDYNYNLIDTPSLRISYVNDSEEKKVEERW